ncbi:MAG: pilus assembly protein TadG-related protein [Bythopirellula sp.]|nr:pilus assembly protein TadG-related protein [Bythopirellula sp.]
MRNAQLTNQRQFPPATDRRGIIVVLTAFALVAIFAFVALSVDTGRMVLTETEMQNACDAAVLAAAQEINAAVYAAGQGQGSANIDANSIAIAAARTMAGQVAEANGVYIDPDTDVRFGRRSYDSATDTWPIAWDADPYNVVQVTARKTNTDLEQPDGELPLAFGWAIGKDHVPLQTSATAFIEARDLVVVVDVSASMNDDSSLVSSLSSSEVNGLLDGMWSDLLAADPKWPTTSTSKFLSTGFGEVKTAAGTYVSSSDTATIMTTLKLKENDAFGKRKYPFPQAGRNSNGSPKSKPSNSTSDSLWQGYINHVKGLSGTYNKKYGYRTLMNYLQESRPSPSQSEDLWRTAHYPFHANRNGISLFMDFLTELDFGDEVGWVAYGKWAEQQMTHSDGEVNIDVSADPITSDYGVIDTMQSRHQAGELDGWTAMGDGILKARELLVGAAGDPDDDGYTRYGARPTMLVMTDGQTNQAPSGWSIPGDFVWADWTDYDGDGSADYTTSDTKKKYAFWEATEAIKLGVVIHTLSVGQGADRDLMRAIAFAGNGIFINVPGGGTADMEEQLIEAFRNIASQVPPAQLVYELTAPAAD